MAVLVVQDDRWAADRCFYLGEIAVTKALLNPFDKQLNWKLLNTHTRTRTQVR